MYTSYEIANAMVTLTRAEWNGEQYWRANDILVWGENHLTPNEMHNLNKEAQKMGQTR